NDSENEDDGNKGDIPYGNSSDINLEGDFDVNIDLEIPCTFVASSPITSSTSILQHTKTYINWAHPDQESHFPKLDVLGSWHVGNELYVGLHFDSDCEVVFDEDALILCDDSYDLLPKWLEMIVQCCPKSTYKLEIDYFVLNNQVDNHFCKFERVLFVFQAYL
ncbi:hypothetical protein CR513_44130, partial [Mucuna pruriens]